MILLNWISEPVKSNEFSAKVSNVAKLKGGGRACLMMAKPLFGFGVGEAVWAKWTRLKPTIQTHCPKSTNFDFYTLSSPMFFFAKLSSCTKSSENICSVHGNRTQILMSAANQQHHENCSHTYFWISTDVRQLKQLFPFNNVLSKYQWTLLLLYLLIQR